MRQIDHRPPTGLSDPTYAAFAWRRFRRLMAWMALAAVASIAAVLWWLHQSMSDMPWPMIAAVIGGVGLSVLLGTGLMGLVFLSSGTGHDEDVDGFNKTNKNEGQQND